MILQDYEKDMQRCNRCSYCKWIPHQMMVDTDFIAGCPSIEEYNFHGWSASGRIIAALSLLRGRIEYTDGFINMIYQCQMDGACDISCKIERDMEPLEILQELRLKCVKDGHPHPSHTPIIKGLKKENNMLQKRKLERGNWAEGLDVKDLRTENAEVVFHAGCRYSYDEDFWEIARAGVLLLRGAGVDIGIMGESEVCCSGRAYKMGYEDEIKKFANKNQAAWEKSGITTIVTPCAECYQAFKVLYDKMGDKLPFEIFHITEYLYKLVNEGKIKFTKNVPITITYHDPCHLGRLSEPWIHWEGKEMMASTEKIKTGLIVHDPPKKYRRGALGVYDIPRELLKSVPGVKLVEMHRIREYAWCCGAGGGVKETYPDFSLSTAGKRLDEAKEVDAEAIVSACPGCKINFSDASAANDINLEVFDIIEIIKMAI